jgi:hypothetical protein
MYTLPPNCRFENILSPHFRNNHSALTYLKKFAGNSRLMRLSLRLSDFDFSVKHNPGSKISHVDAPSRHVGM